MILWFVILYLLASVGIGLYAARRVHSTKDFAVAGRILPLPVVTATVFATWFGAETVLGIPATFVKEGLRGVVADPFGSSLCLILAGLLFARRLYRLNVLTIGDYYRMRYSRTVEVLCTLCIVALYLGWVSAQIKALGLIFHVVRMERMVSAARDDDRDHDCPYLYDVRGHVLGGHSRFRSNNSDHGRDALYCVGDQRLDRRSCCRSDHAASAGKFGFFPSAGIRAWIPFIGAWGSR